MNTINNIPNSQISPTRNKTNKSQPKTYYNVLHKEPEKKASHIDAKKLLLFAVATLSMFAVVKNRLKIKFPTKNITQVVETNANEAQNIAKPAMTKTFEPLQTKVNENKTKVTNPFKLNREDSPVQVKVNEPQAVQPENSIKGISLLLRTSVKSMSKNGVYNPNEIDKLLTKYVGRNRTREIRFFSDERRGIYEGRKKSYKAPDGRIYVLESHSRPQGLVTRLYLTIGPDKKPLMKDERLYLTGKGRFVKNCYFQRFAHLESDNSALEWIRNAGNDNAYYRRK